MHDTIAIQCHKYGLLDFVIDNIRHSAGDVFLATVTLATVVDMCYPLPKVINSEFVLVDWLQGKPKEHSLFIPFPLGLFAHKWQQQTQHEILRRLYEFSFGAALYYTMNISSDEKKEKKNISRYIRNILKQRIVIRMKKERKKSIDHMYIKKTGNTTD